METNHKKGHNKKAIHLKKHKKADDNRSFDPRSTKRTVSDEKPVLFQLGSIASYGVSDLGLKPDPDITTTASNSASPSSSSLSPTSSSGNNILEEVGDSSQHKKELLSLSLKLCELQGSLDTPRSQVSGVTHASVEPTLLSPSLQMMDREEGSDEQQPTLEKNLSMVSNDSLFSLSIGDNNSNAIERDELFSYRDFKAGELLKSGELLSFCPSVHVPVDSSDLGKSFDMEEEEETEGRILSDSDDKSSTSNVSWRNIGESVNNSDETPSPSYPITKKKKKKKKKKQKQKKRCCCWLCCDDEYSFSCCKRLKCSSCCWSSTCGWLLCCNWSCWSCCCCCSSKKVIDDRGNERQRLQKAESKTCHKWFCCFPSCSS